MSDVVAVIRAQAHRSDWRENLSKQRQRHVTAHTEQHNMDKQTPEVLTLNSRKSPCTRNLTDTVTATSRLHTSTSYAVNVLN